MKIDVDVHTILFQPNLGSGLAVPGAQRLLIPKATVAEKEG